MCRFYNTVKRSREAEKEKDSNYIQRIIRENFDASPLATLSHFATGYVTEGITIVRERSIVS
jgi:hypothetical protein